jgi:hypothetical protein
MYHQIANVLHVARKLYPFNLKPGILFDECFGTGA